MAISRPFWVIIHRWAGLTIALFLIVAGLTGTLLAFIDDLDPQLSREVHFVTPPTADAQPLTPLQLREKVLASHPGAVVDYLPLHLEPGRSLKLGIERMDPTSGELTSWSTEADEFFVDPYTGALLGERKWGDITQRPINLMPFVYRLHYSFAAGNIETYAFGIAALIWTLDCFIGFYLTFPARRRNERAEVALKGRSWWSRWKSSWLVRWGAQDVRNGVWRGNQIHQAVSARSRSRLPVVYGAPGRRSPRPPPRSADTRLLSCEPPSSVRAPWCSPSACPADAGPRPTAE